MRIRSNRRQFLRGLGTAIALPMFESLLLPSSRALAAANAARVVYLYLPNGAQWTPDQVGTGFTLPLPLTGLQALRDYTTVLSGVDNTPGEENRAGAHARAGASYLTGRRAEFPGPTNTRSIDLLIADSIGKSSQVSALTLAMEGRGGSDNGYAADYESNISWNGGASPSTKQTDPAAIFNQLFSAGLPAAQATQQNARQANGKSVLDFVLAEANALNANLGQGDKAKLDEYLSSVRDLETRIGAGGALSATCQKQTAPNSGLGYKDRVPVMYDLIFHALACGMTNVATMMVANEVSGQSYDWIGINGGHHDISHNGSASGHAQIAQIAQWHVTQFAALCQRLKDAPEGAGNMLDNSILLFGGAIGDGSAHTSTNIPLVLVGKGGGSIPGGRHLHFNSAPLAGVHLAIAKAAGVTLPQFGDATAPVSLT